MSESISELSEPIQGMKCFFTIHLRSKCLIQVDIPYRSRVARGGKRNPKPQEKFRNDAINGNDFILFFDPFLCISNVLGVRILKTTIVIPVSPIKAVRQDLVKGIS